MIAEDQMITINLRLRSYNPARYTVSFKALNTVIYLDTILRQRHCIARIKNMQISGLSIIIYKCFPICSQSDTAVDFFSFLRNIIEFA